MCNFRNLFYWLYHSKYIGNQCHDHCFRIGLSLGNEFLYINCSIFLKRKNIHFYPLFFHLIQRTQDGIMFQCCCKNMITFMKHSFDDDIEKSKAAGMNAHLAKPIEPERMFQTLYDFIFGKEDY